MLTVPDKAEPKSQEILERTKEIFASKGFDGASMQDLARAAGMSASNFYRYFPSKDALIAAIVERELAELEADFATIMQSGDPRAALMQKIRQRIDSLGQTEGLLWSEIEACATRRPEVGVLHQKMEASVNSYMVAVFARIAGISVAEAGGRYGAHIAMLMLLVHGASTRGCCTVPASEKVARGLNVLIMRSVEALLSEVAAGHVANPQIHSGR